MQTRRRPRFAELPADVRQWAEQALSGPVVRTEPAHGGYSPGVTESLFTADGRSGFIKAGHPSLNPDFFRPHSCVPRVGRWPRCLARCRSPR